jgi:DNA processing protein
VAALTGSNCTLTLDSEGRAAIALASVPGLGPTGILALVEAHGSARSVLEAASQGMLASNLSPGLRRLASRARISLAHDVTARLPAGTRVVPYCSPRYPSGLRRLCRPPAVLYALGPLALDQPRTVTVVGTRAATEYGRRMARRIGSELAAAGWRVASGIARGIDAEAHLGALEAHGETVGVPGCGLGHVYPVSNRALYRDHAERGLLVTEFPPAEGPRREHFPRRNRILAGLARAVVVVQAGRRSGALITVDHANDIGVEVLAVPGPADLPASEGVNELLRDGAGLATRAADVLSLLGEAPGAYTGSVRAGVRSRESQTTDLPLIAGGESRSEDGLLLSVLTEGPLHVDTLSTRTGLPIPATLARLGRMELEGRVRGLPGGRYETVS